jgi:diaminopimelate decarboxylase
VALRVNPDVPAKTHHYIRTGVRESKFGIDPATAVELLRHHEAFPGVRMVGLHLHIGSQINEAAPFVRAIRRVAGLVRQGRAFGVPIEWLNLGGGLGIIYKDERPQTPQRFARAVLPLLRRLDVRLILEPGRFIVGNAGILVTRVLYVKAGSLAKRFVVVDAGMNDLLRPALYGAYHEVIQVHGGAPANGRYDVVGPICESADVFARDRALGCVEPEQYLAILGAGAYGSTMASNYNGRPRPAEVLVRGSRWAVIRRRETERDLVRQDVVPRGLLA